MKTNRNINRQKKNENGGESQPYGTGVFDPYHKDLPMGTYRISCCGRDLIEMLGEFVVYLEKQYPAYVKSVDIRRIRNWIFDGFKHDYPLCCIVAYVEEHLIYCNDFNYRRKLVPHRTIDGYLLCPRCAAQMGYIAPVVGPQRPDRWMGMLAA